MDDWNIFLVWKPFSDDKKNKKKIENNNNSFDDNRYI